MVPLLSGGGELRQVIVVYDDDRDDGDGGGWLSHHDISDHHHRADIPKRHGIQEQEYDDDGHVSFGLYNSRLYEIEPTLFGEYILFPPHGTRDFTQQFRAWDTYYR